MLEHKLKMKFKFRSIPMTQYIQIVLPKKHYILNIIAKCGYYVKEIVLCFGNMEICLAFKKCKRAGHAHE